MRRRRCRRQHRPRRRAGGVGGDARVSPVGGITIDDVRAAHQRIADKVIRTPLLLSPGLSEATGAEVHLKCENLQYVGAFKARGATNAVFSLSEAEAGAGVCTHSSGNHAAALARAARLRGIAAHIVMPRNSSALKLDAVRALGVEPILCEPTAEARQAKADEVVASTGATFIHPYNDPRIIAGQGTVGLEIDEQAPELDAVIVPVGGGGLLSGCLLALGARRPGLPIYGA
ncbi:MAG: pyridoxal-phosphate dependent enzyme, partial [Armatimonadia bacterium]|nr:pyridoxal-phosphate dependent enzyme [Armatimonadia bacterium]